MYRHDTGEAAIQEIIELGFTRVELGYDLPIHFVADIKSMVDSNRITVTSVHNFCPIPVGVQKGHPEIFILTDRDRRQRQSAIHHISRTIEFATDMGAKVVVVHAGRVDMTSFTRKLISLAENGKQYTRRFDNLKSKLLLKRAKKADIHLDNLIDSLDQLLPVLEKNNMKIGLENLPSWEAIPSEMEMERILAHFNSPHICYWHDFGHGQVRQNLGFIGHQRWFERLEPHLAGVHIHDVLPPAQDHLPPSQGKIDFSHFKTCAESDMPLVFEPAPGTATEDVKAGLEHMASVWGSTE